MNTFPRTASDPDVHGPSSTRSSDGAIFVEACIERVREVAGLDSDRVLPPFPVVAPRRDVAVLARVETRRVVTHPTHGLGRPLEVRGGIRLEFNPDASASRPSRWAILMCVFVAVGAASASFVVSPLGRAPSVVRFTHTARVKAAEAAQATAALVSPR